MTNTVKINHREVLESYNTNCLCRTATFLAVILGSLASTTPSYGESENSWIAGQKARKIADKIRVQCGRKTVTHDATVKTTEKVMIKGDKLYRVFASFSTKSDSMYKTYSIYNIKTCSTLAAIHIKGPEKYPYHNFTVPLGADLNSDSYIRLFDVTGGVKASPENIEHAAARAIASSPVWTTHNPLSWWLKKGGRQWDVSIPLIERQPCYHGVPQGNPLTIWSLQQYQKLGGVLYRSMDGPTPPGVFIHRINTPKKIAIQGRFSVYESPLDGGGRLVATYTRSHGYRWMYYSDVELNWLGGQGKLRVAKATPRTQNNPNVIIFDLQHGTAHVFFTVGRAETPTAETPTDVKFQANRVTVYQKGKVLVSATLREISRRLKFQQDFMDQQSHPDRCESCQLSHDCNYFGCFE
jgi:hypothetical protein